MAQRKTGDEQGRRKDSHEGTPSRDEFARRMMDAIRRAGETRPIRYDPDGFTLVSQKGEYHLANAFRAYCLARDRAKMFRNAVALWFSDMKLPEKYEDVNPDLLPKVVRRTEYDASVLERNGDGGEAHGTMPWLIADHLAVVAAYDLPECIMTLMPQSLAAEWGVSYEKALRDACVNLLEISEGPFENPQPGLYVSPWRDNHDASRLVLTNLIRRLDVKGDHVAMVPNRDTLLVTGSADSAGLARMAEIATAALDEPYWLSALPVRLTDGGWVRFMPDAEHPSFQDFKSLRTRSIGVDYGEQQETLNRRFELEDADTFVSSYFVAENRGTREYVSCCVWTDGVTQVLPQTDVVAFMFSHTPEDGYAVAADWDSVFSTMAEAMTPMGSYPERYLVSQSPTPDQLSAMGARNVTEYLPELPDSGD